MRRVLVVVREAAPIAGVDTWIPGTFALVLRDDELVALTEPHYEPAALAVDDLVRDVRVKVPVAETVADHSDSAIRSTGGTGATQSHDAHYNAPSTGAGVLSNR